MGHESRSPARVWVRLEASCGSNLTGEKLILSEVGLENELRQSIYRRGIRHSFSVSVPSARRRWTGLEVAKFRPIARLANPAKDLPNAPRGKVGCVRLHRDVLQPEEKVRHEREAGHPQEPLDLGLSGAAAARSAGFSVPGATRDAISWCFAVFGRTHPVVMRRSWKIRRSMLYAMLASVSFASARAMPIVRMKRPKRVF